LTRRKVFRFGLVWFLVFICIIIPITAILFDRVGAGDELTALVAIIGSMGGLLLMLFSLFFENDKNKTKTPVHQPQNFATPNQFGAPQANNALPPQAANFTPANTVYSPPQVGWREAKTGELVPPSITEGTTRLLSKDE
jgi:hypothetical protein